MLKQENFYDHLNLEYQVDSIKDRIIAFWKECIFKAKMPYASNFLLVNFTYYLNVNEPLPWLEIIEEESGVVFKFNKDPLNLVPHLIGKQGRVIKEMTKIIGKRVEVVKQ
jgi:hypothetical protein